MDPNTPITEQAILDAGFHTKPFAEFNAGTGEKIKEEKHFYWPELPSAKIDIRYRIQSIHYLPRLGTLFKPEIQTVGDLENFVKEVIHEIGHH